MENRLMKNRLFAAFCMIAITVCIAPALQAEVRLPSIFDSNMVLQRDMTVTIWGWADPNEQVAVTFGNQTVSAVAGADHQWQLQLQPMTANGESAVLTVTGTNNVVKLENVLVGDIWICSGQSNMEWSMSESPEYKDVLKTIENANIRLFHVDRKISPESLDDVPVRSSWKPCNAESIPRFSAVGYYFGRKLQAELGVPIGLINSSWGATPIAPWTPPEGFQNIPALKNVADELDLRNPHSEAHQQLAQKTLQEYQSWIDQLQKGESRIAPPPAFPQQLTPYSDISHPATIYNAMIAPLTKMSVKGAIWYQGEANVADGMMYAEKMKALIQGWRKVFNNPDLGFYYAQLAPYFYGENAGTRLPELWEAQSAVEKMLPKTGQAVINDLVTSVRDIHPPQKEFVGERLALLALNRTYGKMEIVCSSPEFDKMEITGNTVTAFFNNADSLKTRDSKEPNWFEIAGADGIYHKADAVIDGTTIKLSSAQVRQPFAIRYAWNQTAEPNVQNEAGLQLGAFRAGSIPERAVFDQFVPDGAAFKLLYRFNPVKPELTNNRQRFIYATDNSGQITGKIKRVGYFLHLVKNNEPKYIFVTMPPLDPDPKKLGVPVRASGARFQKRIQDVQIVASNVPEAQPGTYTDCHVEFWDCNYGTPNTANVPGASSDKFDFGDEMSTGTSPGYGSMQIHDLAGKQTILAFNNFNAGNRCDLGIGNNPDSEGNPDWTFSQSAQGYTGGQFLILVELE